MKLESRPRRRAPRNLAAVALLTAGLLLGGCAATGHGGHADGDATPLLASVTPLTDPHDWKGETTAVVGDDPIEPITTGTQSLPVTVKDSQDTTVTVTDTGRILALDLYGSLSRIVFELGLGEDVVGRDVSSGFPEISDRTLVTQNGHDLNAEAILDVAPTVILTDTSLGPWDVILQMRDAGIPVVVVDSHRSIESVGALTQQVADALGVHRRGVELAARTTKAVEAKIAEIAEVAPAKKADRLRIVFLYVRGQSGIYYLFGEESGADTLITALGGDDIAGTIGWQGMRPVTDEALIDADPDLILMMTKGLESTGGVDGLLEHLPALAQTAAGKNKRIVTMDDTQILSFGPHTARILDALATAIYAPQDVR